MASPVANPRLWERLDELIDRAPSDEDLRSHRLEIPAARRFRTRGRRVPLDFVAAERFAGVALLSAPILLERVRDAFDEPVIVLKGPEVSARYRDPTLRGFSDLDLLVDDANALQRRLVQTGFELVGEPELYVDIHHLRPVAVEGMPLPIEVHAAPKWIAGIAPPPTRELFEHAVAGTTGVDGFLALRPEAHAIVLAVHSWSHEPFRRLRDLVDIGVVASEADRGAALELASRWGVERLWRSTIAVVDWLFDDRTVPWSLRLWAQNLERARERTVFEMHAERWVSDFWAFGTTRALGRLPRRLLDDVRPAEQETWGQKLGRTSLAVRNAARRRSTHDEQLDRRRAQR